MSDTQDKRRRDPTVGCATALVIGCIVCWAIVLPLKLTGAWDLHWFFVLIAPAWMLGALGLLTIAALLFCLGMAAALRWASKMGVRLHTWHNLREAVEGFTLNQVGPIYGVERTPHESNRSMRNRLRRAVLSTDTVVINKAVNGKPDAPVERGNVDWIGDIDRIGETYGLKRMLGESDADYRERIIKRMQEGRP